MQKSHLPTIAASIIIGWALTAGTASATILFGTTQTFENGAPGSTPSSWFDGTNGYNGHITIASSGTDGITTGAAGGTQFAKVTPGAVGTYYYNRGAPSGDIGRQTAFPGSGNAYTTFIDIYAQSTEHDAGHIYWDSIVNNSSGNFGADTGWYLYPGSTTWKFQAGGTGGDISLATGEWYTLEVVFDRSTSLVTSTYNIYAQGQRDFGAPLASFGGAAVDENLSSTDLGGPRYQWFTNWSSKDNTIGQIYVDNAGTGAYSTTVPAPSTLALFGLGLTLLGFSMRRNKRTD